MPLALQRHFPRQARLGRRIGGQQEDPADPDDPLSNCQGPRRRRQGGARRLVNHRSQRHPAAGPGDQAPGPLQPQRQQRGGHILGPRVQAGAEHQELPRAGAPLRRGARPGACQHCRVRHGGAHQAHPAHGRLPHRRADRTAEHRGRGHPASGGGGRRHAIRRLGRRRPGPGPDGGEQRGGWCWRRRLDPQRRRGRRRGGGRRPQDARGPTCPLPRGPGRPYRRSAGRARRGGNPEALAVPTYVHAHTAGQLRVRRVHAGDGGELRHLRRRAAAARRLRHHLRRQQHDGPDAGLREGMGDPPGRLGRASDRPQLLRDVRRLGHPLGRLGVAATAGLPFPRRPSRHGPRRGGAAGAGGARGQRSCPPRRGVVRQGQATALRRRAGRGARALPARARGAPQARRAPAAPRWPTAADARRHARALPWAGGAGHDYVQPRQDGRCVHLLLLRGGRGRRCRRPQQGQGADGQVALPAEPLRRGRRAGRQQALVVGAGGLLPQPRAALRAAAGAEAQLRGHLRAAVAGLRRRRG